MKTRVSVSEETAVMDWRVAGLVATVWASSVEWMRCCLAATAALIATATGDASGGVRGLGSDGHVSKQAMVNRKILDLFQDEDEKVLTIAKRSHLLPNWSLDIR